MRYRMLVAELVGETATVVMDAIGGRVPRRVGDWTAIACWSSTASAATPTW
jgi:hypothetical protein